MAKQKKNKKTTASFVSLGCFKNLVDTEVLGGLLEKNHITLVSSYEESDWLIINTCGFIRDAKEESIDEILAALEKKDQGEIKHVAIFGCLTQRYYSELKENFKEADILWGVNDLESLAALIAGSPGTGPKVDYMSAQRGLFLYDHSFNRMITTTPNSTFIKISEGCNMTCSFCSIPSIRGPYRSREIASIIEEAKHYQAMGFQELNLISQNSTYFGKDRAKKSELPLLLQELSSLGFFAIRVLYLMPEEITTEIINGFLHPSILPYFDLPFQHVSEPVLKRMNRHGSVKKNMELIETIRKKIPGAVIRSSFIVGFPGETEADFHELLRFAEDAAIERIGVFGYSDEENTPAFALSEKIPDAIIGSREELLMDVSDKNMEKYNSSLLQTRQDFLPLGPWDNGATIGRIFSQAPDADGLTRVNVPFNDEYTIYPVTITGFENELIYGEKQ